MADNNRIVIDIGVQGDADVRIKKITDAVTDLGERGGQSMSRFSNIFDIFAGNLAANVVGKAFGVATDAAKKFFDVLVTDGINGAIETEDNINRLNQALASNGKYSKSASDELVKYASALQQTTKFSDDQVLSTQALISTYARLGTKELKQATQAALDLSVAYGINLEQATRMVGKAAAGEADAFSKLKIRFTEGKTAAETFGNAMEALQNRGLSGAAQSQVNTFSGALTVAQHAFEDVTKEIGNIIIKNPALIEVMKSATKSFNTLSESISENKQDINEWISAGVLVAVESIASLVRVVAKFESVIAGDFGKKYIAPISAELDNMSKAATTAFANSIAGAEKSSVALKNNQTDTENLSKAQQDLINKGIELAEKYDLSEGYRKNSEALLLALENDKVSMEAYMTATAELRAQYEADVSASAFKQAESYIESNRAMVADMNQTNLALIAGNQDKLRKLLADERLSEKDRAKIQQSITATEKTQYEARMAVAKDALSGLATFTKLKTKELQVIGKAAAIANATISTYEGADKALAVVPFPFNFAAAAAVISAGLVNVAQIVGVDLATGLEEVPAGHPNDTFRANLSSGEGVLNRRDNRMLTLAANNQALAQGMAEIVDRLDRLETRTTVYVGQKLVVDELRDAYESGRVIDA